MSIDTEVRRLARNASIEIVPREIEAIRDFRDHLQPGRRVFVAWPPKNTVEQSLTAAHKLAQEEMAPVPHIPARALTSEHVLRDFIRRAREDIGAREVLVIAGDRRTPAGPFVDSLAVFQTGLLEEYGFERVNVGAHPRGHHLASNAKVRRYLRAKHEWSLQTGIEVRFITQFIFTATAIETWYQEILSQEAPNLAIEVGLPGLPSTRALLKFTWELLGLTGVLRFACQHPKTALRTLWASTRPSPGKLVAELGKLQIEHPEITLHGLHFYPFGAFKRTAAWLNAVSEGRYHLDRGIPRVIEAEI